MRFSPALAIAVVIMSIGLGGCELIGDVLKVGIWMGVIVVVVIVALIAWLWRKLRGPRTPGY